MNDNYDKSELRNMMIESIDDPRIKSRLTEEWGKEIICASDIHNELLKFMEEGFQPGLSIGISDEFDEYYTVRKKEWTLVTGIPGAGKTEFLDNVVINMIRLHGWKWGLFSAENLPYSRHFGALMEKFLKVPVKDIGEDKDLFFNAEAELAKHIFFINPKEDQLNIDRILYLAEILIKTRDIDALIIDPWNEIDYMRKAGLNDTENISRALTRIRRFARMHDIHIFVIAHPTKLKKKDDGTYPVPTPYDVAGSSHFRNKADNSLTLWYDPDHPGSAKIYIQKIRFKEVGKLGSVDLNYDVRTGVYSPFTVPSIGAMRRGDS